MKAAQIRITGIVQGVGFRPFVYRLALENNICGNVKNDGSGVEIFAQGENLGKFCDELKTNAPPMSHIHAVEIEKADYQFGLNRFEIIKSDATIKTTAISPDLAICPDCITEITNPRERRFQYPFTNCTNCGPRFSIIDDIPYDRTNTKMRVFEMCPHCRAEYENPLDRRFHAQPIACPKCGPKVWFEPKATSKKNLNETKYSANWLEYTVNFLKSGKIMAVKGLSGFHLVCDATNEAAVFELRKRKHRPHKPMAIMLKSVKEVHEWSNPNHAEIIALEHFSAPIVLIKGKDKRLAPSLAPNLNQLGIMIAATPLHYILCDAFGGPLVMTSGNLSGEPMVIDNDEAFEKLAPFVDGFLFHNRDIARRIDDSVVYVENDEIHILRRARGFAPTPIHLPKEFENAPKVLAMGAQMKSSICLVRNCEAIVSHYIGELGTSLANAELEKTLSDLSRLYDFAPQIIATDMHPQYFSTQNGEKMAQDMGVENISIQHHHAHIVAAMAENNHGLNDGKVLGLVFDGTGFGTDGTIWGGEYIIADYFGFERVGNIAPIRLPGGDMAIKEPWRILGAHLFEAFGKSATIDFFDSGIFGNDTKTKPIAQICHLIESEINSPICTSMGRLFDAVSAALGFCQNTISYEGQAAIELENHSSDYQYDTYYTFESIDSEHNISVLNLKSFWAELISDLQNNKPKAEIAEKFHFSLARHCAILAETIASKQNIKAIVLAGGVMQNRLFVNCLRHEFEARNLRVLIPKLFSPNDGSIALGQALIAAARNIAE